MIVDWFYRGDSCRGRRQLDDVRGGPSVSPLLCPSGHRPDGLGRHVLLSVVPTHYLA